MSDFFLKFLPIKTNNKIGIEIDLFTGRTTFYKFFQNHLFNKNNIRIKRRFFCIPIPTGKFMFEVNCNIRRFARF
jgi:hypothetical protein